jgi:DNA gyrase subunit A
MFLSIISKEVNERKAKYSDERRTRVERRLENQEEDLVQKKDVVVTIT